MAARQSPAGRRFTAIACGLALVVGLSGCNYNSYYQKSAHDYSSRTKNDPKMTRVRSYGTLSNDPARHDNKRFEYSSKLSYDVKALPGVNSAIVMVTDKNAYVAILTDWTAIGTKAHGGAATREQDNTGTTEGVYNVDKGTMQVGPRMVTPYNSYFTHKDVSDLSSELKQVIGDTVRRRSPGLRQVYISANQEFNNQMLEFAKLSWGGKPLEPHVANFNRLVQYIFAATDDVPLPLYEHSPAR